MKPTKRDIERINRILNEELDLDVDEDDMQLQKATFATVRYNSDKRVRFMEMKEMMDNIISDSKPRIRLSNIGYSAEDVLRMVKYYDMYGIKWTMPAGSDVRLMEIIDAFTAIDKNMNLNWIDVQNIEDFSMIFSYSIFDGDISEWDLRNAKTCVDMFSASDFTGDISNWNIPNGCNTHNMFNNARIPENNKPVLPQNN